MRSIALFPPPGQMAEDLGISVTDDIRSRGVVAVVVGVSSSSDRRHVMVLGSINAWEGP